MSKVYDKKTEAIWVRAKLSKFDGDVAEWKNSFYELWRYQMTWSFAYQIDLHEVSNGDVVVDMYVRAGFKDNILNTMEYLGYKEIEVDDVFVGEVYAFEHDELDDIDVLFLDI